MSEAEKQHVVINEMVDHTMATTPCAASPAHRLKTISANHLLQTEYPEIRWAVPNLIPEGLTILAGHPKIGKSRLILSIMVGIAQGTNVLGDKVAVERGDMLYLALEDPERRLSSRLGQLCEAGAVPTDIDFDIATECLQGEAGIGAIEEWLKGHPNARMVAIDTLAMFYGDTGSHNRANIYIEDYTKMSPLKQLAEQYHVPIILVHHPNKGSEEKMHWMKRISGSTGLTGSADTVIFMDHVPKSPNRAILMVSGRDVESQDLVIENDENLGWRLVDDGSDEYQRMVSPKAQRPSSDKERVFEYVCTADHAVTAEEIAHVCGIPQASAGAYLRTLMEDGRLFRAGRGKYTSSDDHAMSEQIGAPADIKAAHHPSTYHNSLVRSFDSEEDSHLYTETNEQTKRITDRGTGDEAVVLTAGRPNQGRIVRSKTDGPIYVNNDHPVKDDIPLPVEPGEYQPLPPEDERTDNSAVNNVDREEQFLMLGTMAIPISKLY